MISQAAVDRSSLGSQIIQWLEQTVEIPQIWPLWGYLGGRAIQRKQSGLGAVFLLQGSKGISRVAVAKVHVSQYIVTGL